MEQQPQAPQQPQQPMQPQQSQQPQQVPQQPVPPQGDAPVQAKKSRVWLWVLGGCLGIVILTILTVIALAWWGVNKVKKEVGPEWEQFIEETEEIKKEMEAMPIPESR